MSRLTLAFSCGARSASKLKEQDYLRSTLSRRQLQGFVRRPRLESTARPLHSLPLESKRNRSEEGSDLQMIAVRRSRRQTSLEHPIAHLKRSDETLYHFAAGPLLFALL